MRNPKAEPDTRPSRLPALRLALVLVGVVIGALALAQPTLAVTREQVFRALRLDDLPADYVILVDDSGSMRDSGLYTRVRGALAPLLGALSPRDNVSLISFAGSPAVRYSGPRGGDPSRVLAQLPKQAFGADGTDIGAALGSGLDELERPDAADVGSMVLITDGKHTPPPGSAFPTTSGRAWSMLGTRGAAIAARHSIGAYALALTPSSQADLLKRAFSSAQVVALPRSQLRPYLERVKEQTRIAKARRLVAGDVGESVRVQWPASLRRLDLTAGSGTVEIRLRNGLRHVPVVVSGLGVSAKGIPIKAHGLPRTVEIGPGATRTIKVDLSFSKRGGFRIGKQEVTESGFVKLLGSVSTPWSDVIREDLQTPVRPTLASDWTAVRATGKVGWGLFGLALVVLAGGLIVGFAVYRFIDRRPKLRGSVTVSGPGLPPRRISLHGREMKIGPGAEFDLPLKGKVSGRRVKQRGRRKGNVIELVVSYGSAAPMRLQHGNAKAIGEINFAYKEI